MIKINDVTISSISSCVPKNTINNSELSVKYGSDEIKKLISSIGVETRHIAPNSMTSSDLCFSAAEQLINKNNIDLNNIGAVIFVSQTPDYQLPATACILQYKLGLPLNTIAFDINMGCSGYVYGLYVASSLVKSGINNVLLLVGDTISKIVKPGDRSTELLFGDAGSASLITAKKGFDICFELGTDGSGFEHIIANKMIEPDSIIRGMKSAYLEMDGGEVFSFTLKRIPKLINEFLSSLDVNSENINACVYHQANRFMINHLSRKSKFEPKQVPISIDQFGNTSCASIPLTLCSRKIDSYKNLLLVGFGVGLSWGAVYLDLSDTILLPVQEI